MSDYGGSQDPYRGRPDRPPRRRQAPERDPYRYQEPDDYPERYEERRPPARSAGRGGISWADILFIGLLLLAAARGAGQSEGCLPGKGCRRMVSLLVGSIALLAGAAYLASSDQTFVGDNVIGVMACIGSVLCVASGGALLIVLFGVIKIINLDLTPDDATRQASGLLGGILGGRR